MTFSSLEQPKTLAEWRNKIAQSLGGYNWNTELTEENVDFAIYEAIILYSKYRPYMEWFPLSTISHDTQIPFGDKIGKGKIVSKVAFKKDIDRLSSLSSYHTFMTHNTMGHREPRRVWQAMAAYDRYNSFLGSQPHWKFDAETMTLYIYVRSGSIKAQALVLGPINIDNISWSDERDFLDTCVAYAKRKLAIIYGKFGPVPTAQGDLDFDVSTLRSEAEATLRDIELKLDKNPRRVPPMPIF